MQMTPSYLVDSVFAIIAIFAPAHPCYHAFP